MTITASIFSLFRRHRWCSNTVSLIIWEVPPCVPSSETQSRRARPQPDSQGNHLILACDDASQLDNKSASSEFDFEAYKNSINIARHSSVQSSVPQLSALRLPASCTPIFNTTLSIMFDVYTLAAQLVGGVILILLANAVSIKSRGVPKTFQRILSTLIVRIRYIWSSVMIELMIDDY